MPKPFTLAPAHILPSATPKPRKRGKSERGPRDPKAALLTARLAAAPRRADLLAMERGQRRITEDEYRIGRELQHCFERATRLAGTNWSEADRVDAAHASEAMIASRLEDAQAVTATMRRLQSVLRERDTRIVRLVLAEGLSFPEAAARFDQFGERGVSYIAQRFRDALKDLSDAWAARGKSRVNG